jgi:hypothetical protein
MTYIFSEVLHLSGEVNMPYKLILHYLVIFVLCTFYANRE